MTNDHLLATYSAEREDIVRRLAWLGVRSTGSDRLEQRKAALDALIDTIRRQAV